jgi:hypothetical protein
MLQKSDASKVQSGFEGVQSRSKVRCYVRDEPTPMAFGKWQQSPQPPQLWRLLVMLGAVIATIIWLQRYASGHPPH